MTIRLLDLNIWNFNDPWPTRRDLIVELIRETGADLVALQEIQYLSWLEDASHQAAQIHVCLPDFEMIWHPAHYYLDEQWEGLAILSRYPIVDQRFRQLTRRSQPPTRPWMRGVLGALVRSPDGPFWLFDTHRSGNRTYATLEVFSFVLETAAGKPFALTGDFNVTPDSDDIRFLTGRIEIEGLRGNLIDAWNVTHPGESGETVQSWEIKPGRRIDYVLVTPGVGVRDMYLTGDRPNAEGVYPTDHLGLLADLDIQEGVR